MVAAVATSPGIEIAVLRIVTRCATVDRFIDVFRHLCTATTCFIPTDDRRPIGGVETGFSIRLADGMPVMSGLGVVLSSHDDADHEYRRPGILLGIRTLHAESLSVFDRLITAAPTEIVANDHSTKIAATRAQVADMVRPTTQMPPLFPDEVCECSTEGNDAVPGALDAGATVPTERPSMPTTLGVAPLAPATRVRAPFVIDTPVGTRSGVVDSGPVTGVGIPIEIAEPPHVFATPPRPRVAMIAIRAHSRSWWDSLRTSLRVLRWRLRRRRGLRPG